MVVLKKIILMTAIALVGGIHDAAAEAAPETVVLLHGIARTEESMDAVEAALEKEGYRTLAITYPSRKDDLDGIAAGLHEDALNKEFWRNAGRVHFVTHSMGGLVARHYLAKYKSEIPPEKIGRVVMLAPPNGGSEVADSLHDLWPYQWYYGPAGQELTTEARTENREKPYYDVGIIAGTKEWPYAVAAFVVPGPGDGRVSVEKTKLDGMKDHMTVDGTHTFIMDRPDVHRQIVYFLRQGAFEHDKEQ